MTTGLAKASESLGRELADLMDGAPIGVGLIVLFIIIGLFIFIEYLIHK